MIRHSREAFVVELAPDSYWKRPSHKPDGIASVGDPSLATEVHPGGSAYNLEIFPREAFPEARIVKVRITVEELGSATDRYANLFLDWALQRVSAKGVTPEEERRFARELWACAAEIPEKHRVTFQASIAKLRASNRRKLYVDDERPVPCEWTGVKTADGAILFLEHFTVTDLSLDHDLGEGFGTGYDVICWLEEAVLTRGYPMPNVVIHSQNPVGRANMQRAVDSILQRLEALTPS